MTRLTLIAVVLALTVAAPTSAAPTLGPLRRVPVEAYIVGERYAVAELADGLAAYDTRTGVTTRVPWAPGMRPRCSVSSSIERLTRSRLLVECGNGTYVYVVGRNRWAALPALAARESYLAAGAYWALAVVRCEDRYGTCGSAYVDVKTGERRPAENRPPGDLDTRDLTPLGAADPSVSGHYAMTGGSSAGGEPALEPLRLLRRGRPVATLSPCRRTCRGRFENGTATWDEVDDSWFRDEKTVVVGAYDPRTGARGRWNARSLPGIVPELDWSLTIRATRYAILVFAQGPGGNRLYATRLPR